MYTQTAKHCIAFEGENCIARGDLLHVAGIVKGILDERQDAIILIFDADTSKIVEIDFRGSADDVQLRLRALMKEQPAANGTTPEKHNGPGRPKLGVVSREVTLLPRHWEWLAQQPGGASVTLRKLVEQARRENAGKDRLRHAQGVTYAFMNAIAGDLPGYEEALRALYAGDQARFDSFISDWPLDIRDHTRILAAGAFDQAAD